MPLYNRPVRALMHDLTKELITTPETVISRGQVYAWFNTHYPLVKKGTIGAHLTLMSTNARGRVHHSVKPVQDDLLYQVDPSHYRLYDALHDPAPIYADTRETAGTLDSGADSIGDDISDESAEGGGAPVFSEFAYETDLRDFLAKNLPLIETGLRLYQDEDIMGIEFPVGGRFIDILAVDRSGNYLVIELKVSRGYDRVLGQLLRYMGWIQKNLAEPGKTVRGMIVARDISEDLRLACSAALSAGIELRNYQLSVSLQSINY